MPRVMISGWTLNTPMPIPLIRPAGLRRSRSCPHFPHREHAAEHHDSDEDRALDRRPPVGIDADEGQVGPDEGQDDDRDDRPEDAAASAGETDPAENDRGDALER